METIFIKLFEKSLNIHFLRHKIMSSKKIYIYESYGFEYFQFKIVSFVTIGSFIIKLLRNSLKFEFLDLKLVKFSFRRSFFCGVLVFLGTIEICLFSHEFLSPKFL